MLKWLLGIGLLACVWSAPAEAACGPPCFVVAAGGNSASTSTWTTTSGGSTCTCTPTTTDAVILDSLAGQLTINGALSIGTLDASGTGGSGSPYTATLTHNGFTLTINTGAANSLKFSTQMGYTAAGTTSIVLFAHTSGTAEITSSGKIFAAMTVNGAGGTTQMDDDLTINKVQSSILTVTSGTFTTNGHNLTTILLSSAGATTRTLTLTSSTVKIGGNAAAAGAVLNLTTTGMTLNVSGSTIEVLPMSGQVAGGISFLGGGSTLAAVVFDANTFPTGINIGGANTFTTWTIGGDWNVGLPSAVTTTLTGALTINGTAAAPVGLFDISPTTVTTISSAGTTCAATFTWIAQVNTTGGCAFTAANSSGLGQNTGWTIAGPLGSGSGGGYIIGN